MEDAVLRVINEFSGRSFPRSTALAQQWMLGRIGKGGRLEDIYCAELVAVTFERMGLLDSKRPPNWYDPGRFWSGDRLDLQGASLGPEIPVTTIATLIARLDGAPSGRDSPTTRCRCDMRRARRTP